MPAGTPTIVPLDVARRWQEGGPRPGWSFHAACRGTDPNVFHPASDHGDIRPALALCRECPVRADCFVAALLDERNRPREGIWGGATPDERERIYRRLTRSRGNR